MARKLSFVVIAALGMVLAGAAAWWLQSRPSAPTPVTGAGNVASRPAGSAGQGGARVAGVEVARVQTQALRDDAQAVGSLRARQSVMLRPEVPGRIVALGFKEGQAVRKGQVLVQLDDLLQQAELQQAQAQLAIAETSFKRTQELVAANFVAQQTQDTSAASLQVAQAQLALAQARQSRMAIRAPFDGTVGIRQVNLGDYVKDGADLVTLEDTRTMLADFRLPERYGGRLKVGQSVALTLDALPGRNFKAEVAAIDPLQDAQDRSVAVRAVLKPADRMVPAAGQQTADAQLRSGMFVRVTVVFSVNPAALLVPEEALVPQGGRQFVIKVVAPSVLPDAGRLPTEVQWVSLRQEVRLGVRRSGMVEIVEGVSAGDTVVVAGQQRLQKDGTPLRIVASDQPADQPGAAAASATSSAVNGPGKAGPAASATSHSAERF